MIWDQAIVFEWQIRDGARRGAAREPALDAYAFVPARRRRGRGRTGRGAVERARAARVLPSAAMTGLCEKKASSNREVAGS